MINTEIAIVLNGSPYQLDAHKNVEQLIDDLSLSGKAVAVAINREIAQRHQWPQRKLQSNDCVDVVRAIGGG